MDSGLRTITATIDEPLSGGLRAKSHGQRNANRLADLQGLMPVKEGLKGLPAITYPLTSPTLTPSWPHPHFVATEQKHKLLLCDEQAIYPITIVADDLPASVTAATIYNAASSTAELAISAGQGQWHCASFADSAYVLTNGEAFIFSAPSNVDGKILGVEGDVAKNNCFTAQTVANHDNRLVLGNLLKAGRMGGSVHSGWTEFFNTWAGTVDDYFVFDANTSQQTLQNWILWSERGGGARDYPYAMLLALLALPNAATYTKVRELVLSAVESGEMGLMPLQNTGEILCLKRFGNDLMAYGKKGVSSVRWTERGYREYPVTDAGICGRSAVGGDGRHIYVTPQGHLHHIYFDDGVRSEELGFEEFIGEMTLTDIVVSFDPEESRYWIADGSKAFILNGRDSMAKCDDTIPMSVMRSYANEGLFGSSITVAAGHEDSTGVSFVTEPIEGDERAVWEAVQVMLSTTDTDATGWQIALDWRMRKNAAWTRTSYVTTDPRGIALLNASGTEFRIVGKADDRSKVDLEKVTLGLKRGGRRSLASLLA